jgi:hypothetical protein
LTPATLGPAVRPGAARAFIGLAEAGIRRRQR